MSEWTEQRHAQVKKAFRHLERDNMVQEFTDALDEIERLQAENNMQRLALRQSGRLEGFNAKLNVAASQVEIAPTTKQFKFLEDRLSSLSMTVARNKKESKEQLIEPKHKHEVLYTRLKECADRIEALEDAPYTDPAHYRWNRLATLDNTKRIEALESWTKECELS